jgi:hypothetical protein
VRPKCLVDRPPKRSRIDGRESVEQRFDSRKILPSVLARDQLAIEHRLHVVEIPAVASLQLRERLANQVEMTELRAPNALDEYPAVFPTRRDRDEIQRRGRLDVDLEVSFNA